MEWNFLNLVFSISFGFINFHDLFRFLSFNVASGNTRFSIGDGGSSLIGSSRVAEGQKFNFGGLGIFDFSGSIYIDDRDEIILGRIYNGVRGSNFFL